MRRIALSLLKLYAVLAVGAFLAVLVLLSTNGVLIAEVGEGALFSLFWVALVYLAFEA